MLPRKEARARAQADTPLKDLPRIEDLPRLPERLRRIDPEGAGQFEQRQQDWQRNLIDALQRYTAINRAEVEELKQRVSELEP